MSIQPETLFARLLARGLKWRDLLWLVYAGFGWWCLSALSADIRRIEWASIIGRGDVLLCAAALPWCNHMLRTVRWQIFLRQVGQRYPFPFVAVTYLAGFAFTISPGKVGEMIRARYYVERGGEASAVHGAFVVERLLDLLVMVCLASMVLSVISDYQSLVWVALGAVLAVLCMVSAMPWTTWRDRLATASDGTSVRAARGVVATLDSAKAFLAPRVLLPTFALSLLSWGAEAAGFMVLVNGLAPDTLNYPMAAGIYAAAIIVGALSFLPGGLGSTEAVLVALLTARGLDLSQAMLITVVWRFLTLWLAVAGGWLCVAWLGRPMDSKNGTNA